MALEGVLWFSPTEARDSRTDPVTALARFVLRLPPCPCVLYDHHSPFRPPDLRVFFPYDYETAPPIPGGSRFQFYDLLNWAAGDGGWETGWFRTSRRFFLSRLMVVSLGLGSCS